MRIAAPHPAVVRGAVPQFMQARGGLALYGPRTAAPGLGAVLVWGATGASGSLGASQRRTRGHRFGPSSPKGQPATVQMLSGGNADIGCPAGASGGGHAMVPSTFRTTRTFTHLGLIATPACPASATA